MSPSHLARPLRSLIAAASLAAALPSVGAEPASGAEPARTTVTTDLYGRGAPNGVMLFVGALRRWDEDDGPSPLLRGRYVQVGAAVGSNPAYAQGQIFGEWVPLAPLQLRAQYDAFGFYGASGALLRLPSRSARFGSSEIAALSGSEQTGVGHRLMATPILRVRAGPLLLRNQTDLAWYRLSGQDGWYYEWEYDTLVASSDFVVSNRIAALVELWRGAGETTLLAGPAYEVTHAGKADITRQRVEAVGFWSPVERFGALARPRLLGIVGVNLQDRNRKGEAFAVVGMGADVDL